MTITFKKWIYSISTLFLISPLCYADNVDVFVSGGATFSRLNNETSVAINDFVINDYKTNKTTVWEPFWGVGVGHTFENINNNPFNINLGLAGYYTNFGNIKGTEYPFVNGGFPVGTFDTLNYQFKAQSYSLMLESRLFYTCYPWQPFALVGIGNAWNRFSNYNEVPTDPSQSAAPVPDQFSSHTQTAFAYELGAGVQRQFYNDTAYRVRYGASLDYRYFNLGKGNLDSFPAMTTNDRLTINNLYTQAITLSLTASFY